MAVKATKNCLENFIAKGIQSSNIAVLTPTVVLDIDHLQSVKKDCACQVDASSSSSENWFKSFMAYMDMTETELETKLTESEDDTLFFDPIDCVVQTIKSVRFKWPQCPIQMLQTYLQAEGLGLDVLENNPILFTAFKQKLYKAFQCSFPGYSSLLHYVNNKNFHWLVM